MATWTLTAQLTTGTLAVAGTDRIWYTGAAFTDNVVVGSYQDSTHISNSSDVHQCSTNHVNNTKWLADTGASSVSLNGAAASNITALTTANAGLKFNFADGASVATSNGKFYAYDGTTDATAMVGVTFKAYQISNGSSWTGANGSGSALTLADQAAATSHDFFLASSVSPTSTGAKTGRVKISLTYV
jgi:hypothetical protein